MIMLLGGNTSSAEAPPRSPSPRCGGHQAQFRIDAGDHRQAIADLVDGDVEHLALLVEGAGMHFGGVRIGGERGEPADGGDIAQMLAVRRRVDGEIRVEGQQAGRYDARRNEIAEARHDFPPPQASTAATIGAVAAAAQGP